MDLAILRQICRKYQSKDVPEYFADPVPGAKAKNARESLRIRNAEEIIALVDFTVFGSAKNAFAITDQGVCWKTLDDDAPGRLSWAQLRQRSIAEKMKLLSKAIDFGNGVEMDLSGAQELGKKNNHTILALLKEIVAIPEIPAAPVVPADTTSPSIGLVQCEFCGEKVKPGVLFCKHCGLRLAG